MSPFLLKKCFSVKNKLLLDFSAALQHRLAAEAAFAFALPYAATALVCLGFIYCFFFCSCDLSPDLIFSASSYNEPGLRGKLEVLDVLERLAHDAVLL